MNKIFIIFTLLLFNCNSSAQKQKNNTTNSFKVNKTDAQWQAELSEMEYLVLRQAATERPFSSPFNKNYEVGIYVCTACQTPLFNSEHKFDSGTGWPSFDKTIEGNVAFSTDNDLGYIRVEEHCATCGGHLGHVFTDGPKDTTGERHCINGVALTFIPEE